MAVPTASTMIAGCASMKMRAEALHMIELPGFLCPAFLGIKPISRIPTIRSQMALRKLTQPSRRRLLHHDSQSILSQVQQGSPYGFARLPQQCAGCGSLSQTVEENEPGFYTLSRRSVKEYIGDIVHIKASRSLSEDQIVEASLQNVEDNVLGRHKLEMPSSPCRFFFVLLLYYA